MFTLFQTARYFSSAAFLYYGIRCIASKKMVLEFERFHLSKFRVLNGSLQILAAIGLIVGQYYSPIFYLSAGGLTLQMLMGAIVRIKLRDSLAQTLPALFFMALNAYLLIAVQTNVGPGVKP